MNVPITINVPFSEKMIEEYIEKQVKEEVKNILVDKALKAFPHKIEKVPKNNKNDIYGYPFYDDVEVVDMKKFVSDEISKFFDDHLDEILEIAADKIVKRSIKRNLIKEAQEEAAKELLNS